MITMNFRLIKCRCQKNLKRGMITQKVLWNGQRCRTGIYSRKIPLDAIIILQNLKILTLCGKRRCCFIKVGYSKPLPPMIRIPILECELCKAENVDQKTIPFHSIEYVHHAKKQKSCGKTHFCLVIFQLRYFLRLYDMVLNECYVCHQKSFITGKA